MWHVVGIGLVQVARSRALSRTPATRRGAVDRRLLQTATSDLGLTTVTHEAGLRRLVCTPIMRFDQPIDVSQYESGALSQSGMCRVCAFFHHIVHNSRSTFVSLL